MDLLTVAEKGEVGAIQRMEKEIRLLKWDHYKGPWD